MNETLANVVAWSLRCAAEGKYPDRGFYNEEFSSNTYRSLKCGKTIAGQHKLLESSALFFFSLLIPFSVSNLAKNLSENI